MALPIIQNEQNYYLETAESAKYELNYKNPSPLPFYMDVKMYVPYAIANA